MKPSPRNSVPGEFQQTVKFSDSIIALCQESQGQYQVGLRTISSTVTTCCCLGLPTASILAAARRKPKLLQRGRQQPLLAY